MRSSKMRYSPWSSSEGTGKGKGKRRAGWNCGEKVITTAEIARMRNKKNSWTDGGAWKNQKGSEVGKDAGTG